MSELVLFYLEIYTFLKSKMTAIYSGNHTIEIFSRNQVFDKDSVAVECHSLKLFSIGGKTKWDFAYLALLTCFSILSFQGCTEGTCIAG